MLLATGGCSFQVKYALKTRSLNLESCPSQLLFFEITNESWPKSDSRRKKEFFVEWDNLPISQSLGGVTGQGIIFETLSRDEEVHVIVFCESKRGRILFDSKQIGFRYYDEWGRRTYAEGKESIHFLDEPARKKIILNPISGSDD